MLRFTFFYTFFSIFFFQNPKKNPDVFCFDTFSRTKKVKAVHLYSAQAASDLTAVRSPLPTFVIHH